MKVCLGLEGVAAAVRDPFFFFHGDNDDDDGSRRNQSRRVMVTR
jgi:hypothetical protein